MEFLTTPGERFQNLQDYPFSPNYVELGDGMKRHYVDEGPQDAEVVLMLHGEPSWSYLYRKMIPIFVENGFRAIAPDLIGFGKSDKPANRSDYTYARYIQWTKKFVETLDLQNMNLFCQDWGGLIGLRIATEDEGRFNRIIAANTTLPTGHHPANDAFLQWQEFSQKVPIFPVGGIINRATVTDLSPEVIAAYDAPFPDETYKEAARIFPVLVPLTPDDPESVPNQKAWAKLKEWNKPFLTLFGDSDPIMLGMEKIFQQNIPGATGQPHAIIEKAGHFLQEDQGEELARKTVGFINNS